MSFLNVIKTKIMLNLYFLGLDQKKLTSGYLTTLDVCMFLKMVEKLNLGTKVNSEIQTVWTSKKVNDQLFKILLEENMCEEVSKKVTDKVLDVLQKLDQLMKGSQHKNQQGQNRINVFKVSRMIVEEIIKIRMNFLLKLEVYTGFEPDKQVQPRKIKDQKFNTRKIIKIIEISQISSLKKLFSIRAIQQLTIMQEQVRMIKKNELAVLLLKIGVLNFDQLDRRFRQSAQVRKQLDKNYQSINETPAASLHNIKSRPKKINYQAEINNLYRIQIELQDIVSDIVGDVGQLNNLGLIKLLQNSISTQLI